MAVKDLTARQGKVDIIVEVKDKASVREFEKFGKSGRVCNAMVSDETGEVQLTLWNDDIDKINVGDKVHITNGYVSEWQGKLQLSTGKFGQMEVITGDSAENTVTEDEKTEADLVSGSSDEGEHIMTDDEMTEEEVTEENSEPSSDIESEMTDDEKTEEDLLEPVEEEEIPDDLEKY